MNESKPAILGGPKTRESPFLSRKTMGTEEVDAVKEVLENDTLSAFIGGPGKHFLGGPKVLEFEKVWAEEYGFAHAISVNSWTSGLVIAVGALGIEPGDEVICSPFTMSASATCALFYGGIPVFADIDPENYCLDPVSIESRITPRTKAIIIVHLFGGSADMDAILSIARKHGLKVIEDAAQAPGVMYKGKPVGALGDIGGFSLNFHKHIHTGEGGMLVTNDPDIAFRAQLIRNHGENYAELLTDDDLPNLIGGNYRLTELQAAIGIAQLRKLPALLEIRNELVDYVNGKLTQFEFLTVPTNPAEGSTHAYYIYPMQFHDEIAGISRNLFVKAVNAEFADPEGYESVPLTEGYVKPLYMSNVYQKQIAIGSKGFPFNFNEGTHYDYSKGICPVAEHLHENSFIASPLLREPLTKHDMNDFVQGIEKVARNIEEIKRAFPDGGKEVPIFSPIHAASKSNVR